MKLARRVGVPMVGVNLPAHFMIRPVVEDMEVLVDCFKGGELVFVEDVEDMLKTYYMMGRRRGERRSLRTSLRPAHLSAHYPSLTVPTHRVRCLSTPLLTPLNSTPISSL